MGGTLTVTCMVDEATVVEGDPEFRRPPRNATAEYHVMAALRELGHEVRVLAATDNVHGLVRDLVDNRPDVVFNLTELFRWDRRLDANIAGLLELIGVPYTGTGPAGLMLARNKGLSKHLLNTRKIRVPRFAVLPLGRRVRVPVSLNYPLVVKPLFTDGSEGISNASLVSSREELEERAGFLHERFKQAAIAEEYVEGREVYIGVTGSARLRVLPPRELFFGRSDEGGPVLATYKLKWDEEYQKRWLVRFDHGDLDDALARRVSRICRRAFRVLQLRDYGRVDLRVTPDGQVYVLEVNPNPNLARDDELAQAAHRAGIGYASLIDRILHSALRRASH